MSEISVRIEVAGHVKSLAGLAKFTELAFLMLTDQKICKYRLKSAKKARKIGKNDIDPNSVPP
jgi:hypothetical protein